MLPEEKLQALRARFADLTDLLCQPEIASDGGRFTALSAELRAGLPPRMGSRMGQKRIHLVVRGRVQDVFFRASAQREARRLGLTGWVRNRTDGAVELIAEGEEDQVKDLLAWAQHGPSTARVDKVDTRWRSYTGEFADFRIMNE
jgi:acylphosphatase